MHNLGLVASGGIMIYNTVILEERGGSIIMLGKLIVVIVVLFLIALSVYLIHDSLPVGRILSARSGLRKKVQDAKDGLGVKNTNAPVICIKPRGEQEYQNYIMTKKEVKIGRSSGSDIVLEDETVEGTHAVVRKIFKDDKVYYELVNLSRRNPVEYFNQKKGDYIYLGYKKGVVLGTNEVFYLGETKVIIKCPVQKHEITKTERMVLNSSAQDSNAQNGIVQNGNAQMPDVYLPDEQDLRQGTYGDLDKRQGIDI